CLQAHESADIEWGCDDNSLYPQQILPVRTVSGAQPDGCCCTHHPGSALPAGELSRRPVRSQLSLSAAGDRVRSAGLAHRVNGGPRQSGMECGRHAIPAAFGPTAVDEHAGSSATAAAARRHRFAGEAMSTPPVPPPSYYQPRPRSIFGPLALITLGVLFLLRTTGLIAGSTMRFWFARYWPLLLVVWGVAKLIEHILARSKGEPTPRLGGGAITFLIFFVMFSWAFSKANGYNWSGLRDEWGIDPAWDWGWSGRYEFTDNFAQPLAGGTQI